MRTNTVVKSTTGVIRSFVLLRASQPARIGLHTVMKRPTARYVIVKRKEGGTTYWYSYVAREFIVLVKARLETMPRGVTLKLALNLHEYDSKTPHRVGTPDAKTFVEGAVVLGARGKPVGVVGAVKRPKYIVDDQHDLAGDSGDDYDLAADDGEDTERGGGYGSYEQGIESADDEGGGGDDWSGSGGGGGGFRDMPPPPAPTSPPGRRASRESPPRELETARRRQPRAAASDMRRPFAAWPNLVIPASVAPLEPFVLTVGFARQQQPDVVGGPVVIVEAPQEFDLRVQVSGVGFDAPAGWIHGLHVTRDDPWTAHLEVELVARPSEETVEVRALSVQFYYESNLCGHAQRSIVVAKPGTSARELAEVATNGPPASNVPISVKPGRPAPDLTVTVKLTAGRASRESFVWLFASPHPITIPQSPAVIELESDAGTLVDALLKGLVDASGQATAALDMRGIARQIAGRVPAEFWVALREVAHAIAAENRAPDVLFVTEETRLPWELAWMPKPLLDSRRPNHLGAQVNFGRWILGSTGPPLPPESKVPWQRMVVVVGNYPAASGLALPDAIEEAKSLTARSLGSITKIDLNGSDLLPVLEGVAPRNGAQILHFACHGKAKSGGAAISSLTMQNGAPFTATTLRGAEIGEKCEPFLFLNACEVGRAGIALGVTAGFAGAALFEGFRGFVGPLWEVDSQVARLIAVEFYKRVLDQGEPIASVLREMRSQYVYGTGNAAPSPDTYLAYVFYGHPALRLEHSV